MSFGGLFGLICYLCYLCRQNNPTNEFLDLKLVEKEVLVEIFGQIVQYIIFSMSFGGHFGFICQWLLISSK